MNETEGGISCLCPGRNLSQQFTMEELHESREIPRDHLYPGSLHLIVSASEGSAFEANNLSRLAIGSEQCTATVRAKYRDFPIRCATHPRRLSAMQPLNHILSRVDKEPRSHIRQGNLRNVRIEFDQIPRTRIAQNSGERVTAAAVRGS
ncbi:hypothetical protein [Streptomyces sp. SYSU K217416]